MTEPRDPFSERPYVPPTERTDETPSTPDVEPRAVEPSAVEPGADTTDSSPSADAAETHGASGTSENEPVGEDEPVGEQTVAATDETVAPTSEVDTDEVGPVVPGTAAYASRYPTAHEYAAADTSPPAAGAPAAPQAQNEPTVYLDPFDTSSSDTPSGSPAPVAVAAPPRRRGRKLVTAVTLVALAGGAGYGGAYLQDRQSGDSTNGVVTSSLNSNDATPTKAAAGAVEQVAAKVLPSVVQINVKGSAESGSGTGIIVSSDGRILTNNHVVAVAADGGTITVAFSDGTNTAAKIVGRDPVTDIAVIQAENKTGLQPASLGTSGDLQVGQEVVAIGSPFGLESTVTQGIVSALNRPVSSSDGSGNDRTVFPAVQTDAAINPGNSGGPLVDLAGNVIGINSAIRAGTTASGTSGSIGLGFAIPIDLAKNIAKQLIAGDGVEHARIGVSVGAAVSGDDITGIGAEIGTVNAGSAGADAGLEKGDIITAVNGHAVASPDALIASVLAYQPGEKIEVTYQRDGKTQTIDVELGTDKSETS